MHVIRGNEGLSPETFDFSAEAGAFRAALFARLQKIHASDSPEELSEDDLDYVNAAGSFHSIIQGEKDIP